VRGLVAAKWRVCSVVPCLLCICASIAKGSQRSCSRHCCACVHVHVHMCVRSHDQREGYLRTSSEEYTFDLSKSYVHLTNHCLQKHSPDLGKYEEGNTLNFEQFQQYLDDKVPSAKLDFRKHLWPRVKVCWVGVVLASGK